MRSDTGKSEGGTLFAHLWDVLLVARRRNPVTKFLEQPPNHLEKKKSGFVVVVVVVAQHCQQIKTDITFQRQFALTAKYSCDEACSDNKRHKKALPERWLVEKQENKTDCHCTFDR